MARIIAVGTAIYPRPLRLHPTTLEIPFAYFIRTDFFCLQSLPSGMRIRNFKNHICVEKGPLFKRFLRICIDIFTVCSSVGAVSIFIILLAVKTLSVSQVKIPDFP